MYIYPHQTIIISGAWDDSGVLEINEKSSKIMEEDRFKLHKWTSNSRVFQ